MPVTGTELDSRVDDTLAEVAPDQAAEWLADQTGTDADAFQTVLNIVQESAQLPLDLGLASPQDLIEQAFLMGGIAAVVATRE